MYPKTPLQSSMILALSEIEVATLKFGVAAWKSLGPEIWQLQSSEVPYVCRRSSSWIIMLEITRGSSRRGVQLPAMAPLMLTFLGA